MVNQYLTNARTAKLWTPEEASERVGVTIRTYYRWEAGIHIPTLTTLKLLCIAFSEDPDNPVKPEFLGYIVEKDRIRPRPPEDNSSFMNEAEKPTGSLAFAYEEMVESLHRSLTLLLGREASEKEASEVDKLMRVVVSILTPSLDMASVGVGMWLCDRANKLKAIGTSGLRITVQQYLTIAYAEIESWKRLIDEDYQPTEAYRSTRRIVIGSLALFPPSFLVATQFWPMSDLVAQGFVTQCAPCIMACSYLLKGNGFAAVEKLLPQYLPQLVRLAKSPSSVQKEAAYLAAQGLCLIGTVKGHRRKRSEAVGHCKQAVELAKVTGDRVLVAATLTRLATAYSFSDQLEKYLEACQGAERLVPKVSPLFPLRLQHRIYMGLSNAHACLGHVQEATNYLALANALPLSFDDDDPFIPALDYDLSQKRGMEGEVRMNLGKLKAPDPDRPLSKEAHTLYREADAAYGQPFPEFADVAERARIQNIIERAEVAVILGNKEGFKEYFIEGALGAKALESDARLLQARKAWRAASKRWQGEDDVQKMDELLD